MHGSKPRGDHSVFTHFPKDPNCGVRRMTKTTRARCKHSPLKRADGMSTPTSFISDLPSCWLSLIFLNSICRDLFFPGVLGMASSAQAAPLLEKTIISTRKNPSENDTQKKTFASTRKKPSLYHTQNPLNYMIGRLVGRSVRWLVSWLCGCSVN